jgi:CheY-like chemotaxis protein
MGQNNRKKRVLFVDYEVEWRYVPEINWLEHTLNCEVILATNSVSALEKVERASALEKVEPSVPFNLIILDTLLPGPEASSDENLKESGLRFLRKLKELYQKVPPVIVYTTLNKYTFKDIYEQFEEEGAIWLAKDSIKNFKMTTMDKIQ